ncbi:LOW QUALITY PROTEIN: insulin receptor substrate 1-B-like [Rhinatrema bivittatum]|uniref:LOW QUALITY PROTEIN: insulin receptor substrate 1-B-like n=1 Tax=Rhinatrema bivittatum TaxID=194408 RepID=UPI00112D3BCD|nr:LOW QUALITY PROTEIN: insulin receptor substrate 1-B-like [Rhinatrema bivittatum]
MEQQPLPGDVKKCGYLRKQKSSRRRFFVLRCASGLGPARLEYYESEKKFRAAVGGGGGGAPPRGACPLEGALAVNKRVDARQGFLLVLYGRDGSFGVVADGEEEQQQWHAALQELLCGDKASTEHGQYGIPTPGPLFKEVWQVSLRPKGLGQAKNLVGVYRLCLTAKTINFVKLNSDVAAVVLPAHEHSEVWPLRKTTFLLKWARSAVTGPGEFWMQVEDSVVAQNMHETVLEAMKALSEEFRLRSKSQSLTSNPISVPPRRHHTNPPPSQVGFSRRSRAATDVPSASPAPKHDFQRVNMATEESDGSRLASEEGSSASSTPTLCAKSLKGNGSTKIHPLLSHIKCTPVPSNSLTSLPSPVRTSSLGPDCIYTQTSSTSVSESPNDYSFISSDECGSSPSDYSRASFDPMSYLPSSLEDSNLNYITMAIRGSLSQEGQCHRRLSKWASGKDGKTDRNLNKQASLGKATSNMPRRQNSEEYTMMVRTPSRESFTTPVKIGGSSYPDTVDMGHGEVQQETGKMGLTDNGYMTMLPGVLPVGQGKSDDYMPMTPNSVSPPRHIEGARSEVSGYMVMSPNGSCSPDNIAYRRSWAHGDKFSVGSNDSKMSGSDYMNMSPQSRSASSTPPDTSPHLADDPPKMVYSYYSLPRSYKHASIETMVSNPSTCSSSHVSCSSSTSSESLDDPGHHNHHSQIQHGLAQQGETKYGKPRRPVSLFIDVSKANTLPKVRESPLPPEPKSPGEYVSIAFKAAAPGRTLLRPVSCIGTEYMNMDLGLPTGSQIHGRTIVDCKPQRKPCEDMTEECLCAEDVDPCLTLMKSPTLSDYTEMAFSAGAETPKSSSPKEPETNLIEHLGPLSAQRLSPNPSQGPKLIRVDPQSRRRHCSETFLSVPAGAVAPISLPFADHAKRHSSASFENVWSKAEPGTIVTVANERLGSLPHHDPAAMEHGLNYIDLDLAKEGPPVQSRVQLHSSTCGTVGLNSYASIDFNKSEELRSQKSSKDGTGTILEGRA